MNLTVACTKCQLRWLVGTYACPRCGTTLSDAVRLETK